MDSIFCNLATLLLKAVIDIPLNSNRVAVCLKKGKLLSIEQNLYKLNTNHKFVKNLTKIIKKLKNNIV